MRFMSEVDAARKGSPEKLEIQKTRAPSAKKSMLGLVCMCEYPKIDVCSSNMSNDVMLHLFYICVFV